ncbi:MAG TPA: class I SAM-dependent rRNA methyltransferase [Planctomycetia bacterium]|nr:class I SAM-dependent rRNA methyltransferase [Planctomycetia bacterium]
MSSMPTVTLQARKAKPFFGKHPWLFSAAIDRAPDVPAGTQVRVLSFEKEFVAYGLYNPDSNIRVRLYSWEHGSPLDEAEVAARIRRAVKARTEALGLGDPAGACRLIYSESDFLSGLVVDRYADVLVVQMASKALAKFEPTITATLVELLAPRCIVRRVDKAVAELEKYDAGDATLHGAEPIEPFPVAENGLEWLVDVRSGQKTGLYLDQRENRMAFSRYARGRDVLDVCCYTGGFALTAMKHGGVKKALGIDSSGPAVRLAQRNAERNGLAAEFLCEAALPAMQQLHREGRRFGAIALDPPKFARTTADLEAAIRGYDQLNKAALDLLEPGGILCTCSCSGRLSPGAFVQVLASAAQKANRPVQILEQRGQPADHPISAYCLETAYLKCLIARCAD